MCVGVKLYWAKELTTNGNLVITACLVFGGIVSLRDVICIILKPQSRRD
jgi:hypothetical protein